MTEVEKLNIPFRKKLAYKFRKSVFEGGLMRKLSAKKKNIIFYILLAALPIAQFVIFYVVVNFNSLLLAFKSYDTVTGTTTWVGFKNFEQVFKDLFGNNFALKQSWKNSFIAYGIGILFGVPLSLFFSFYIYKKYLLSKFFKFFLFLPSIISSIAMIIMFSYFAEDAYPDLTQLIFNLATKPNGLLSDLKTTLFAVLFYTTFTSFGTSVIMYSSAMGNINESLPEAAKIDGANSLREFFSITVPMIWPTLVTFLVVGVAGIFTNQIGLYAFFGGSADFRVYTFGYYLFRNTAEGTQADYPYLAAMGLVMTLFAVPITYLFKFVLERFGPRRN